MAGYTRQSVADIIANAVIKAAPVNAEFNAIRDAFNNSTGHKHDGTSAEGAYVPLIADLDAKNKVVVDTANNRISFYSEVSSAAVEQVRIQDGAIVPVTTNDVDLGTSSLKFKNLYVEGIGAIGSVTILGGTIDNVVIGGTTPAVGNFTDLSATGTTTITTADINGGNIDNTVIGSTTPLASTFTTVTTTGQAALATVDIDGGTIDGAVIGGTTAQAITGTLITATTNFSGALTGNVTGNVTGDLLGDVTGDVTGALTGNVTASSGSSSFNDVVINGTLNMNAGTTATITNLTTPVNATDAATKGYVDTGLANLVDSAPAALDTLNELAAALGDDASFSTTITNSIATKLPLAGGTMTGVIAMGTSKITGLGDPTANQDASTKLYTDTQDATKLNLTGGTMTGAIDMGSNKVTTTAAPTVGADLTNKTYVDGIIGSATSAATSASAAATSATNSANSATASANSATGASNSATAAAGSATNAAASYDDFDDRYLGAKATAPTLDNDGDALIVGALYFNTTTNFMYVNSSSGWVAAGSSVNGTSDRVTYTATSSQTVFSVTYDVGFVDVYLNGVKLVATTDFTASSGTNITLTTGATAGDIVDIVAYGSFILADHYTKVQSDARYAAADDALALAIALG